VRPRGPGNEDVSNLLTGIFYLSNAQKFQAIGNYFGYSCDLMKVYQKIINAHSNQ
jgi:hypothetical protein